LIPAIYHELKEKSVWQMDKVLCIGTTAASVAYVVTGLFGYVTFANHDNVQELMERQNILDCYEDDLVIIRVCMLGVLTIVLFASPFCILPAKDSFEELLMPEGKKFTFKLNALCTFSIILVVWGLSLLLDTLGQVMTLLGATTNSGIGFLIPIILYLKVLDKQDAEAAASTYGDPKPRKLTPMRMTCYTVFVLVCICSCIELYSYAQSGH